MSHEIPAFFNNVIWEVAPEQQQPGELPHVTHFGVLDLFGYKLRCYRLSDGRAIFEQNDFLKFMDAWFSGELEK